ncbi:Peptidase M15 [Acinetobacter marinus]|uniref:Peptidase M15 n=2 Tax=Acinetobacter marinus TaxID=281375 RepID=A0A1G6GLV1_9GAMM|nr:Peptidase M15 [Acinetobacter marinus]
MNVQKNLYMRRTSQCFLLLASLPFILSGCTTTQQTTTYKLPKPQARQVILNPQQAPNTPSRRIWVQQPPADYVVWLNQYGNKQRVQQYEQYLKNNRVNTAVPTYQLLKSARDWQKCGRTSPYAVPSPELWGNAIPTLKIIQYLVDTNVLRDFEVTSVYRDYSLNICAGGAAGSKHVYNSAIDFRLGPEYGTSPQDMILIEDTKIKLCNFWMQHGQSLNMGLGVYASGQIHIDTQGYRTWGPDHTHATSICQY